MAVQGREQLDQIISGRIRAELTRLAPLADADKLGLPGQFDVRSATEAFQRRSKDLDPKLFTSYSRGTHELASELFELVRSAADRLGVGEAKALAPAKPEAKPEPVATPPAPAPAVAAQPTAAQPPSVAPPTPTMSAPPPAHAAPLAASAPFVGYQTPSAPPMPGSVAPQAMGAQSGGSWVPQAHLPNLVPNAMAYGPSSQEIALRARAEAAEARFAQLQYHGTQLYEQLKDMARRKEAAEILVEQLRARAESSERHLSQLVQSQLELREQLQALQHKLLETESAKTPSETGDDVSDFVSSQVGVLLGEMKAHSAQGSGPNKLRTTYFDALEDLRTGRRGRAASTFRSMLATDPENEDYQRGLEIAESDSLDGAGFDEETTSGFERALLIDIEIEDNR